MRYEKSNFYVDTLVTIVFYSICMCMNLYTVAFDNVTVFKE